MQNNLKKLNLFIMIMLICIVCIFCIVIFKTYNTKNLSIKIKNSMIPIKTVEANNGFEDLAPLEEILEDKKVIGIGEATHGTKEFFQMKHRMLEFLVEKMDYRLFAIEDDFGVCEEINKYVLYGDKNGKEAIRMLIEPWKTKEVENMIEWMKSYNENPNHKGKIKFYGIDFQDASYDIEHILLYIKDIDNDFYISTSSSLEPIKTLKLEQSNSQIDLYKKTIEDLYEFFNKNKEKLIEKTSEDEYDLILMSITNLNQYINYIKAKTQDYVKSNTCRDDYMSKNLKSILDYESRFGNEKIMIWAHNLHVSKHYQSIKMMGENLKDIFGDDYYAIGFDFYTGSFLAPPSDSSYNLLSWSALRHDIEFLPTKGSFSDIFEKTKIPIGFMDFKSACKSNKDIEKWLNKSQLIHNIGYAYDKSENMLYQSQIPLKNYDGIIFIRDTSCSIPTLK